MVHVHAYFQQDRGKENIYYISRHKYICIAYGHMNGLFP